MAGEPLAMAGRMLADLGADVVKLEPAGGDVLRRALPVDPLSGTSLRFLAWNAGKTSIEYTPGDRRIDQLLSAADVIIETPGYTEALELPVARAPDAVWLKATPFGLQGPRSNWRASDLGIMAASGNLYATGNPSRAPLRCAEPASYAHASAEAVFAILTALASGQPQLIDLSMQEAVLILSMGGPGQLPKTGNKGQRQGAPVTTNLMLAPANCAAEILASPQLAARNMFAPVGTATQFPTRFCVASTGAETEAKIIIPNAAPELNQGPWPDWPANEDVFAFDAPPQNAGAPAWQGLKLVEFGCGAAGAIASRYFTEHGATVIKVESCRNPDFLRVMPADSPQGLEGSTLFDALNVGKQSITLNLGHPQGQHIARQLIHWADAVLENVAPKALKSYGLDYQQLVGEKPDLLMLSTCLNGHTGPDKDYPGSGGQDAALSGFNVLTGWPDREPIGRYGPMTDSLTPRFAASALAAGLLYRRRTGHGLHLDVSQAETGVYSLSPWLLDHAANGRSCGRNGNRSPRAVPHGVFPCAGTDRWIAIACWNDHEWLHLATILGLDPYQFADLDSRLAAQDEIERIISAATHHRTADSLAKQLQYAGIEAVPVADFEDLLERDPQLKLRQHFVRLERQLTGESLYERNGFRLSNVGAAFKRAAPLLGEHTDDILANQLDYTPAGIDTLRKSGALY